MIYLYVGKSVHKNNNYKERTSKIIYGLCYCLQPKNGTRDKRMGRVSGVSAQAGQWVHGKSEMPGTYSEAAQDTGVPYHLHCGAGFWRPRQGHCALHDLATQER